MVKNVKFDTQIELPCDADHDKSPIRYRELLSHLDSEKHVQNDGVPNQMLVMTATGPRLMFPKVTCQGMGHYSCDCNISYDDNPPLPPANFRVTVLKNNVTPVPDIGTLDHPKFQLQFTNESDVFRFIPEIVYDLDLATLEYNIIDNTAGVLYGMSHMAGGVRVFTLHTDFLPVKGSDILYVHSILKPGIGGSIALQFIE